MNVNRYRILQESTGAAQKNTQFSLICGTENVQNELLKSLYEYYGEIGGQKHFSANDGGRKTARQKIKYELCLLEMRRFHSHFFHRE